MHYRGLSLKHKIVSGTEEQQVSSDADSSKQTAAKRGLAANLVAEAIRQWRKLKDHSAASQSGASACALIPMAAGSCRR